MTGMAFRSPSIHRLVTRVGVVVALLTGFGIAPERLRAQNSPPRAVQDPRISFQERAECLAFDETRTSRQPRTGAIRFIGTEPGRPIPNPVPVEAARSPEAAARAVPLGLRLALRSAGPGERPVGNPHHARGRASHDYSFPATAERYSHHGRRADCAPG